MKKTFSVLVLIGILILIIASMGEAATLNLRATWNPNTETDMKEYRLYRTDGTRVLIGTVLHPATTLDFTTTVPDQSTGMANFVLTAVDQNNNESADSAPASYVWNTDTPPGAPSGVIVIPR